MVITTEQYDKLMEYLDDTDGSKAQDILDIVSDCNWTIVNDYGEMHGHGSDTYLARLLQPVMMDIRNICKEHKVPYLSVACFYGENKHDDGTKYFSDNVSFNTSANDMRRYISPGIYYEDYKAVIE